MVPHNKKGSIAGSAHHGHNKTMDLSMGAHRLQRPRKLNLNIYSSREIEKTKYDENYQKRVEMKELIFYMQKDPLLRKSEILYQTLNKN